MTTLTAVQRIECWLIDALVPFANRLAILALASLIGADVPWCRPAPAPGASIVMILADGCAQIAMGHVAVIDVGFNDHPRRVNV